MSREKTAVGRTAAGPIKFKNAAKVSGFWRRSPRSGRIRLIVAGKDGRIHFHCCRSIALTRYRARYHFVVF